MIHSRTVVEYLSDTPDAGAYTRRIVAKELSRLRGELAKMEIAEAFWIARQLAPDASQLRVRFHPEDSTTLLDRIEDETGGILFDGDSPARPEHVDIAFKLASAIEHDQSQLTYEGNDHCRGIQPVDYSCQIYTVKLPDGAPA